MQGIEISKKYYEEFGAMQIHETFPELEGLLAVGLAGSGSEAFGFDDESSRDHDFEPGFCIWIPEEDVIDSRTAFQLERMYAKLPKEYMGLQRNLLAPAGGSRHGVIRISEFLERHIGRKDADLSTYDWFTISEYALAEVVNGQIWRDDSGLFTEVRKKLKAMPEDVRLKKLAGCLYLMGQSGEYNYNRCIAHGEKGAAQLALAEYANQTMHAVFLLNKEYMPYYKWSFRALRNLEMLPQLADKLEYLLNTGNEPSDIQNKADAIEYCNTEVIGALRQTELTTQLCSDLGKHADSVNNKIKDGNIRNADLLAAVNNIV